eukprot:747773-Hanusia_phi.AAC.7
MQVFTVAGTPGLQGCTDGVAREAEFKVRSGVELRKEKRDVVGQEPRTVMGTRDGEVLVGDGNNGIRILSADLSIVRTLVRGLKRCLACVVCMLNGG